MDRLINGLPWLGYWEKDKQEAIFFKRSLNNEKILDILKQCKTRGVNGIWSIYSQEHKEIFDFAKREKIKMYFIVPNTSHYIRSLNQIGMVRTGIKKIMESNVFYLAKTGLRQIKNLPQILNKDFSKALNLLTDLDIMSIKKYNPEAIFLDATITDLAVANNNQGLLNSWILHVKKTHKLNVGLYTKNFKHLLKLPGLETDLIATPLYLNKSVSYNNCSKIINTNPFANNTLAPELAKVNKNKFLGCVFSINSQKDIDTYLNSNISNLF